MIKTEQVILANLLTDEAFLRKVIPFLKAEYFHDRAESVMFQAIAEFVQKYKTKPSKEAIVICVEARKDLRQGEFESAIELVEAVSANQSPQEFDWLIETTEKFCKDKAVYNAILESIQIIDGKGKNNKTQDALPDILQKALSVSFDTRVGHDYLEEPGARYDFYHASIEKIPFGIAMMDKITKGGLARKTLNVCMASTGVGKTMFMCSHAANVLKAGYNALYITLEMSEERIAERIDANLMNQTIDGLHALPRPFFDDKARKLKETCKGRLIIKEYPCGSANANHCRALLDELAIKKKFRPDVIFLDYLNLCSSSRLKMGNSINSFNYVKSIAEEMRGLATEANAAVMTATQTNREGSMSSDPSMGNVSESWGLPATSDFFFILIADEELLDEGKVLVKQEKNRYNDYLANRKFLLGVNRAKMRFEDLPDGDQEYIADANGTEQPAGTKPNLITLRPDKFRSGQKTSLNDWKLE